jgi:hypothetical protein
MDSKLRREQALVALLRAQRDYDRAVRIDNAEQAQSTEAVAVTSADMINGHFTPDDLNALLNKLFV